MTRSGMLVLMDAQARDQWYRNLEGETIPAISEANILNTFEKPVIPDYEGITYGERVRYSTGLCYLWHNIRVLIPVKSM